MKRIRLSSSLIFIASIAFRIVPAISAPQVYIAPADTMVIKDTAFQLKVCVTSDSTDIMGYNITISFDSLVIKISSVDEGSFPLNAGHPTFFHWLNPGNGDHVQVNGAILGTPTRGHGVIFTLTFDAVNLGITDVTIAASEIRDGNNTSISHTTNNGIVRVIYNIETNPVSWGVIKSIFKY
jgi:hypothetical protein